MSFLCKLQRDDAPAQSASDDQHVAVVVVGAFSICHVNTSPLMVIFQDPGSTTGWSHLPPCGVKAITGTYLDCAAAACSYLAYGPGPLLAR
jgi:hypothetical protein